MAGMTDASREVHRTEIARTEIAIVGAGPYGLSLAAHLRALGLPFRIIGRVMETWREQMPEGMLLKSDGFASDLSDPRGTFRLHHYCQERQLPYHATCIPVELSTFAGYGVEFQHRMVPQLEDAKLVDLARGDAGFFLTLSTGETFMARMVVLAVGISHYAYIPPALRGLAIGALSHSSQVRQPAKFAGKKVAVVGSGASAIDLAALLHEAGATVTIISRRSKLKFHNQPKEQERSLWEKLRQPGSGLGPGWKSRLLTEFPHWFRLLPVRQRLDLLRRLLGPSGGWPMRERVQGKVTVLNGVKLRDAEMGHDRVLLTVDGTGAGVTDLGVEQLEFDHVIAATGYQVDLRRLPFLGENMRRQIRAVEHMPVLSSHFESSVPGLYFVGISSALTFGPMMRFAYGSAYTARRLERHLLHRTERRTAHEEQAAAMV
jgi:pyruvate/2-oxoglutarate dehydrogenase complex dihydrolipoamide dehydrogenase (E3) component